MQNPYVDPNKKLSPILEMLHAFDPNIPLIYKI